MAEKVTAAKKTPAAPARVRDPRIDQVLADQGVLMGKLDDIKQDLENTKAALAMIQRAVQASADQGAQIARLQQQIAELQTGHAGTEEQLDGLVTAANEIAAASAAVVAAMPAPTDPPSPEAHPPEQTTGNAPI